MRYLLDSNICIAWLKGNDAVIRQIVAVGRDQIGLCAPVKAELWFGACKSQRPHENQATLTRLFRDLPSWPLDDRAATIVGELRADLARQGTPIGPYDLLIAGIAIANGLTLVTHNTREFSRIPTLLLEDWLP